MAIEANSRKRKHKAIENGEQDDAAVVEPKKKVAKKSKSPKKQKKQLNQAETGDTLELNGQAVCYETAEQSNTAAVEDELDYTNEESNRDSGVEPDEKELKFSRDFKMLNFRAKLKNNNFITELRHFLYLTHARPQIVAKYIEKRGKPLELAEALERVDKTNLLHIGYLCQALQVVLMEILTNQKVHLESAVHACRYFLKAHGGVVEQLLKSAQLKHRRIALKLLTAIVCVEPQLGRQLLSAYDILSNVKTIETFLSHSKHELHEEETVRKCFIHFVLAYLVEGNTLLIRNILDRVALISALASGLLYDDHVTVCVVLSTLREYVLECAEISKTKKIHVFDLECCKHLARLYDWHGPNVFAAKFDNKKGGAPKHLQNNKIDELVNADERAAVAESVHKFLVVLLTSRKHGVAFDTIKHFRQKQNVLQGKVIGFLYKPWCDPRKTELIVNILIACPDLGRNTIRNFAGIVNPMRTADRDWIAASNFLATLITTLQPKLLSSAIDKITLTDLSYWIKDICLPLETLVLLKGAKILRSSKFAFRVAANRLLLAMFTQYANYMTAIAKRGQSKGGNTLRRFKFDILNHILVNFPTIESILFSLNMSIKDDSPVLEHLEVTLDLVLIICKENRAFVDKTNTILDYLKLLRPLYANDSTTLEAASEDCGHIKLEFKAVKTILLLFPKALEPKEQLFASVMQSFIKAFVCGSSEVQSEAGELLRDIFKNTGLFESCELEIDLWLEPLRFCDAETINIVTLVFIEVLQVTQATVDAPKTAETLTNERNLSLLFENIEKGLSVQAYIETLTISKLMPLILKGVTIVKPLQQYLEAVSLLMYHYHPTPKYVYELYQTNFTELSEYMNSWLYNPETKSKHQLLHLEGKTAAEIPCLQQLQLAILNGERKFEEIFEKSHKNSTTIEIDLSGSNKLLELNGILKNERMVMIYVQQILFVVAQLVAHEKLQRAQAETAALYLNNCLSIVQKLELATAENGEVTDSFLARTLDYIFSVRLSRIRSAALFSAGDDTHLNYLLFLRMLTENCNQHAHFDTVAFNFRLKIVKAVAISLQHPEATKQQSDKLTECIKLVRAFNLHADNCVELLNLLASSLKYDDFFVDNTTQKSIYYELLVCVLQRLAALQQAVKCDYFVQKFVKFYTQFIHKIAGDVNLETLDEAFHDFLCTSHQHIPQLGAKFFDCMFAARKLSKQTIKLACLLLKRDESLHTEFLQLLPNHIDKKELIYPLLEIAFSKQLPLDANVLQRVYQAYKTGFMKTIEKPQKAGVIYKEHVAASIALIEQCMPKSECVDFCNKNFKFDVIELYQIRVIHAIYKKAYQTLEPSALQQRAAIFVNFINLQIQMLAVDLKKQALDLSKIELFGYLIYDWWQQSPPAADMLPHFAKPLNSQQWFNFCKSCLKLGMHIDEGVAQEQLEAVYELNGLLLKLLAFLCSQLYADYTPDATEADINAFVAQLFEMICTHSKYYDILLRLRGTQVKTQLLHLLATLARKSPSAMLTHIQIPVILGAYHAKLTPADRYALALLQLYELHGGAASVQQYRPFIWGESAVAFYALLAAAEERLKLTQQETSIALVMSIIDRQVCEYTIDNFPIWRCLNAAQQLPAVEFENPQQRPLTIGANTLEQRIERGGAACTFDVAELRLCPKRAGIYEECYDPAFVVPLMNLCFAPEAFSHAARPVQNGLLALVFTALSAQERDMRLAAGCAQLRYRAHFEQRKFYERPLWSQAYDNIQAGLNELRESWLKHKRNSGTPRVPLISGLFVAKAFNLTTEPTHLLYKPLTMYLRLKSTFNFQCVPEFNVLFHSPEVEHHSFRRFIVEVIRDGIKSSSDLFLLVTTNTFKVLMGFYGTTMSTLDLNLLILSVFSTCVKIPASTKIMLEHVGILPWLNSIIANVEFYHFDIIEGLISILSNLWYALQANAGEFHNLPHLSLEIHRLLVLLLPHLSARISPANFAKLLNILNKTATGTQYLAVTAVQLDHLIDCAQKHFPALVHSIEAIKTFGGGGVPSHEDFCRSLHQQQVTSVGILALSSLRSYCISWWRVHNEKVEALSLSEGAELS